MSIKDHIGAECFDDLGSMLREAFPGGHGMSDCRDVSVEQVVEAAWADYQPEYGRLLGIPEPPADRTFTPPRANPDAPECRMYLALATHKRVKEPFTEFVGRLPLVRVRLPETEAKKHETPLGTVEPDDHFLNTVADVCDKVADPLGYHPERVDLITPPRSGGARFAAVASYLGYRDRDDASPSFYILEAGIATGEASVLFFGQTMDTVIEQRSSYLPTPFASPKNLYRGRQTVRGDEPDEMWIHSYREGEDEPYIEVDVTFEARANPGRVWPGALALQALVRLAVIGDALGQDSWIFGPTTPLAAKFGRANLEWVRLPSDGPG